MFPPADLTQTSVDRPVDGVCASGHFVPEEATFRGEKTRFFSVTTPAKPLGIFCEPCLVIAGYLAQKRKNGTRGRHP